MKEEASSLQRTIRQSRPFRSPGHEATVSLLHTADRVRRVLGTTIEPHGITLQQYNVLRILRGAKEEGGLPTLEIAHRMIEQTPGITRLLDRLEAKRLIRRQRCPRDRRQILCWITPSGLELLAELDEPVERLDEVVVARLQPPEQVTLIRMLDAIRAGLNPNP